LRSSLASATSLLALLLANSQEASATTLLSFGNVLVGQIGSGTDTVTVTGGTGTTLKIAAPGAPFGGAAISQSINVSPQNVTGSYTFSPLATGAASSTTPIVDNGTTIGTLTLTGTGVAPVAVGPATSATFGNFVLVNSTQTSTVTLNVGNAGNGSLATSVNGSLNNLLGTITSGNSVFVGTGSISLPDNTNGTTVSNASASFGFTFHPTVTGVQTGTLTTIFTNGAKGSNLAAPSVTTTLTGTAVAPIQSVTPTGATIYARAGTSASTAITISNVGNGNRAGTTSDFNLNVSSITSTGTGFKGNAGNVTSASLTDGNSTTLGYTYTPISRGTSATTAVTISFSNGNSDGTNTLQTVASTLTGSGVGPVFTGSIKGGSVSTPTAVAGGVAGAPSQTISFGSVGYKQSHTVYLELQNTSTDLNGGNVNLTNLTILDYSISGLSAFSVPLTFKGSTIAEGQSIEIPITVIGDTSIGSLNSTLTIFTDESVGYGGHGDTFTYSLTALSVPEPTSLVALGAGLAGLASIRRRRATAQ
jgi:hypothetical protein